MSKQETQGEQTKPKRADENPRAKPQDAKEIGGPKGPEPIRYGDWELNGRCVDF